MPTWLDFLMSDADDTRAETHAETHADASLTKRHKQIPSLESIALQSVLPALYEADPEAMRAILLRDRNARADMRKLLLRHLSVPSTMTDEDLVEIVWLCDARFQLVKLGALPYKLAEALRKIFENFLIHKDSRDGPAARNYANFVPCRTSVATDGRVEIKIDLAYNLFDCLLDAYDQAVYVEMANLNVQALVEGSEPGEVDPVDFNIVPETVAYDAFAYAKCEQDAVHEEMVCELMEFFKGPSDDYEVSTEKIGIDAAWSRKPRVRLMVDGKLTDL